MRKIFFVLCFACLYSSLLISNSKGKEYVRSVLQKRIEDSKINGILDLSKMQIKSLDGIRKVLDGDCKKIREIHLDFNKIKKIDRDDLNKFRNLEILDLSFNKIKNIEKGAFSALKKLKRLDLSGNKIEELCPQIFINQRKLKKLDLSDNDIKTLKMDLFRNLSDLEHVNLADNNISSIPPKLFNRNKKLKEIYLRGNFVKSFEVGFGKRDWTNMIKDIKIENDVLDLWALRI